MNYDWKRLFVGTVPANFCHWWALSLLTVVSYNSEPWNYDWKRLFVGTVPANFCHWPWTMIGRGYLLVLSLQIFVIDHELWLEEVICWYCPCKFFHLPWTMTGRYLWVLSLQIFVIDYGTMAGRGYWHECPRSASSHYSHHYFGTSSRVSDLEQVAIKLIILFSFFLSFSPGCYFSTRRVGARALKFGM